MKLKRDNQQNDIILITYTFSIEIGSDIANHLFSKKYRVFLFKRTWDSMITLRKVNWWSKLMKRFRDMLSFVLSVMTSRIVLEVFIIRASNKNWVLYIWDCEYQLLRYLRLHYSIFPAFFWVLGHLTQSQVSIFEFSFQYLFFQSY